MAPKGFVGLVKPSNTKHRSPADMRTFFAKDQFTLLTLLLIGAVAQLALFATLPYRVAMLPAGLAAVYSVLNTAFQTARSPANKYMDGVILGRTSAQLPVTEEGDYGNQPAAKPVLVFHFGVRFNHPLGLLAPGAQEVRDHFEACNGIVQKRADEYGVLGMSAWRAGERASNNTLMTIYYFKDVDGLNKFAHDDIHRKAWDWIVKADHKHIGFFHEAFCVPARAYESIYVNCQPMLMGATNVKVIDDEGEEKWVQPVVDANAGPLKSQLGRMGRSVKEGSD